MTPSLLVVQIQTQHGIVTYVSSVCGRDQNRIKRSVFRADRYQVIKTKSE